MPNWCASGTCLYATFALGKLARYEETLRFSASFNDSAEVGGIVKGSTDDMLVYGAPSVSCLSCVLDNARFADHRDSDSARIAQTMR